MSAISSCRRIENEHDMYRVSAEQINQYLDFLIDPSFQVVNRFFVLSFENEAQRTSYKRYYLLTREKKIIML